MQIMGDKQKNMPRLKTNSFVDQKIGQPIHLKNNISKQLESPMSTILTTWLVISFFFTPRLDPLMKTHYNMELLIHSKQEPLRIIIMSCPKPLDDT